MRKFLVAVWMMTAATCLAQQLDLKALDKLASKAKEKTEINMDESMLKSALGFLQEGDEAVVKKSVKDLKGFFLRSYEFAEKGAYKMEDLKPILDQLKAPGWSPFLRTQESDELTEIWMHQTNGQADGMVLVAAESNEITVINAIGMANLADLSALGKLGDLSKQENSKKAGPAPIPGTTNPKNDD